MRKYFPELLGDEIGVHDRARGLVEFPLALQTLEAAAYDDADREHEHEDPAIGQRERHAAASFASAAWRASAWFIFARCSSLRRPLIHFAYLAKKTASECLSCPAQ